MFDLVESDIDGIGPRRLLDVATHISARSQMPWGLMNDYDKIDWLKTYKNDKTHKIPGVGPKSLDKMITYYKEGIIS